jgi:hypothetical protein
MNKIIVFLIICLSFSVISYGEDQASIDSYLDEINNNFTYKGKPIHPKLIYEFSNWLSDNRPSVVKTVDVVASFDTNEYQLDEIEKRSDWYFYTKKEELEYATLYESFGYKWVGKTKNNIHVLETGESGGGSGFFKDLMLVKFSKGAILWKGREKDQILMSIVGSHMLGDRYKGDIKVYPNKVFIPASSNQCGGGSLEEDIELEF